MVYHWCAGHVVRTVHSVLPTPPADSHLSSDNERLVLGDSAQLQTLSNMFRCAASFTHQWFVLPETQDALRFIRIIQ